MGTALRALAVLVVTALVAACPGTSENSGSSPASPSVAETAAGSGRCPASEIGTADADSVLVPGPGNGLPRSTVPGARLVIEGVVLDSACSPAADASLHVWHTDAQGAYGPTDDACCYYQGTVRTDQDGRFRLETIRPGRYAEQNAPPAHIHVEIRHQAGKLMTELVFAGDPGVPTTPMSGIVPVVLREAPGAEQVWRGEVTLVLQQ